MTLFYYLMALVTFRLEVSGSIAQHNLALHRIENTMSYTVVSLPRTFPVESFAHDVGRSLVNAEYGYPKGYPNTTS
jgi:hypothetical protein